MDELAALMDEFKLEQASLNLGGFEVAFRRRKKPSAAVAVPSEERFDTEDGSETLTPNEPEVSGQAINSPMTGIFYLASSPSSPPFVKVGDVISVGQTIGLIEAMKVFNEIPSPIAGLVVEIPAESGAVVQAGQVLIRLG